MKRMEQTSLIVEDWVHILEESTTGGFVWTIPDEHRDSVESHVERNVDKLLEIPAGYRTKGHKIASHGY